MITLKLGHYTWYLGFASDTWFDDFTKQTQDARRDCKGTNPNTFGVTLYQDKAIILADELDSQCQRDTLLHELGHVIGWMTGRGDTTEGDANLFALVISQLGGGPFVGELLDQMRESRKSQLLTKARKAVTPVTANLESSATSSRTSKICPICNVAVSDPRCRGINHLEGE